MGAITILIDDLGNEDDEGGMHSQLLLQIHTINAHTHRCMASHLCSWDVFKIKDFSYDYSSYLERLNCCMASMIVRDATQMNKYFVDYGGLVDFAEVR